MSQPPRPAPPGDTAPGPDRPGPDPAGPAVPADGSLRGPVTPGPAPRPPAAAPTRAPRLPRRLLRLLAGARRRARRHLPPGLRLVAGLVLILGGGLGFLPVLGFWMIPLGAAIAALDLVALRRWWRAR